MEFVASTPNGKRLPQSEIDSLRAQTKTDLETLMPLVDLDNKKETACKEAQIYSLEESGVTDVWQWVISLSENDDTSFSLKMDQVIWESADDGEGASHALDKFKTGAELFSFVQSFWDEDHGEGLSEEAWQEIEANIRGIDVRLADEVRQATLVAFGHEVTAKSREQEAIDHCVASATWAREARSGGGAMWAALADRKQMDQALGEFVKAHYGQHGRVPEGVHVVLGKSVTFAKSLQVG
jgi:hypothetical protein